MTDVRVRAANDLFYYPDVVVACVPVGDEDVYLDEPCLIVEVLSPSTAGIDRREKLVAFRQIASLRGYLLVAQARRRVERHIRDAAGAWHRTQVAGAGAVEIPCPVATLPLDIIYEGVALPVVSEPDPADYDA